MKMYLKPTVKQQLKDYRSAGGVFFLVNVMLVAVTFLLANLSSTDGEVQYSGYGFIAAIFIFVMGIVLPRQSMRLGAQMGVSRRTTFVGLVVSSILGSLALAAAGEALLSGAVFLSSGYSNMYFADFYWLLYLDGATSPTLVQHLISILFNTCLMLAAFGFGLFFTLLFWRLNKVGCVIAGISIPVILIGAPGLTAYFDHILAPVTSAIEKLVNACIQSEWIAMATFLVVSAFWLVIGWLLVCRTNIRGTALK